MVVIVVVVFVVDVVVIADPLDRLCLWRNFAKTFIAKAIQGVIFAIIGFAFAWVVTLSQQLVSSVYVEACLGELYCQGAAVGLLPFGPFRAAFAIIVFWFACRTLTHGKIPSVAIFKIMVLPNLVVILAQARFLPTLSQSPT